VNFFTRIFLKLFNVPKKVFIFLKILFKKICFLRSCLIFFTKEYNSKYSYNKIEFRKYGYETVSFGKVFHPGKSSNFSDDQPYSWTRKPFHPSTQIYKDVKVKNFALRKDIFKNLLKHFVCTVAKTKHFPRFSIIYSLQNNVF
jgi:hypothetical protein